MLISTIAGREKKYNKEKPDNYNNKLMFDFMIERREFSRGCTGLLCSMHILHHTDEGICFIDNKMISSETWSK